MRKRARIDINQKDIVGHIRTLGGSVLHTYQLGHGAPDIVVGINGVNVLVEIKNGDKPLTTDEVLFHETWRGYATVVRSLDDATKLVYAMTEATEPSS
jgi:hypothetical protein